MDTENVDAVRKEVRDHYGQLSREGMGCCGTGGCCVANPGASEALGYTAEQLADAPEGANLGLGCGNPQAIARADVGGARARPRQRRRLRLLPGRTPGRADRPRHRGRHDAGHDRARPRQRQEGDP